MKRYLIKITGGIIISEARIAELELKNAELEERLAMLEFRVQLLSENTNISRLLFEYNITHTQYIQLMDLMDELRKKIDNGEKIDNGTFEKEVYSITNKDGDYHFCESLAQSFMEDGRWEEIFPALYGNMDKYAHYMERRRSGED